MADGPDPKCLMLLAIEVWHRIQNVHLPPPLPSVEHPIWPMARIQNVFLSLLPRWGSGWVATTWRSAAPWRRRTTCWRRRGRSRWRSTGAGCTSSSRSTTCWTWPPCRPWCGPCTGRHYTGTLWGRETDTGTLWGRPPEKINLFFFYYYYFFLQKHYRLNLG